MKIKFRILKREFKFSFLNKNLSFYSVRLPEGETAGITSRCTDCKHVLFLDYDGIERWLVEDELKLLQHYFKLTPFYLFTTKEETSEVSGNLCGNYHAICLTKNPVQKTSQIQDNAHIDWKYKGMFRISRYKSWVLRSIEKGDREPPKYIGLVGDMVNLDNDVSEAHTILLKKLYDVDDISYTNLDGLKETFLTSYKTNAGLK